VLGQTLTHCEVDLESNCLSHGIGMKIGSRIWKPDHFYVYEPQNKNLNMVYKKFWLM
jgi:hypothetical protein